VNQRTTPQFEYILFDLDDTLYPREAGVMEAIIKRILMFMTHKLKIPADDAPTKRYYYYQHYGTALRGLMEEHHIDPAEFLSYVHDLNLANFLGASPPLDNMLGAIPLRKVVFTNSDVPHSERVLAMLQVRHHFESIIDILATKYKSKPDPLAYQQALNLLGVRGQQCIMVEDSARNLIPAKDMGMMTILVGEQTPSSAVDYVVPTIFHVEQILEKILPMDRG
jgi:putative hydrolase of the HAD superfamily